MKRCVFCLDTGALRDDQVLLYGDAMYACAPRGQLVEGFAAIAPYTVGFVEMDEGYFLFTQIEGPPESMQIGNRVQAHMIERGGQALPVFTQA